MLAILSAKAVWAATKDVDATKKVRTASIIAKKSRGDIEICWSGSVGVLGLAESEGAGNTRGIEGEGEVGNGAVTIRAVDTGIWGSSVDTARGG